ncbi:MAG: GntR family transcriptional regulator [Spartobacteria bacterium]|nr:GntR family transcriptional regulator [Spartobacteria bacterium]
MTDQNESSKKQKLSRSRRDREYLYHQLAEIIRKEINEAKYKPGDRLPSMDRLAAEYRVNKVTVRRALAELTADGLIYSVAAQGTYIAEPPAPVEKASPNASLTVGLLSPVMVAGNTGFYHLELIEGVREELAKVHANLVLLPVKYVKTDLKVIEMLTQANLDAVLLVGHFEPPLLRRILTMPLPSVLMDHVLRGTHVDTILVDNQGGGYQAIEHLLSLGHTKLAIVSGPRGEIVTEDRLKGAYAAIEDAGLPEINVQIIESNFTREGGFKAMAEALDENHATGFFIMNDEMAAGALQAINALTDYRVPEHLSIVSFDDTTLATATHPRLTSVRVAKPMMGRIAVERVLSQLNQPDHTPTTTVVPTQLIVRDSTAEPPKL